MRRPDTLLYGAQGSSSHHDMMQQSSMSGEDASPQVSDKCDVKATCTNYRQRSYLGIYIPYVVKMLIYLHLKDVIFKSKVSVVV